MSLGEDLMKMSLSDPVSATNKPPKPPTLEEVKKSLRVRGEAHSRMTANYLRLVSC